MLGLSQSIYSEGRLSLGTTCLYIHKDSWSEFPLRKGLKEKQKTWHGDSHSWVEGQLKERRGCHTQGEPTGGKISWNRGEGLQGPSEECCSGYSVACRIEQDFRGWSGPQPCMPQPETVVLSTAGLVAECGVWRGYAEEGWCWQLGDHLKQWEWGTPAAWRQTEGWEWAFSIAKNAPRRKGSPALRHSTTIAASLPMQKSLPPTLAGTLETMCVPSHCRCVLLTLAWPCAPQSVSLSLVSPCHHRHEMRIPSERVHEPLSLLLLSLSSLNKGSMPLSVTAFPATPIPT